MKKIKVAFFTAAILPLLATSTGCSPRKSASAKASEVPSAKPEEESTASNGGVIVPGATIKGAIEGSKVFVEGCTITIPSLWVCDHEVTQGEYEQYCSYYDGENSPSATYGKGSSYPVYYVSWRSAIDYCNKRSVAENLTPCYYDGYGCDFTANGYRLPTEAEWEYLARGGNTSNSGQTEFSGSNDIEAVAWYEGNSGGKTHQVKAKAPNAIGLYDMTGNVDEWCYDEYFDPDCKFPIRVTCGSSWDFRAFSIASHGARLEGGYGEWDLGFRVVRTVSSNDAASASAKNESDKKASSDVNSEVFIKGRTVEIWAKWCCDHEVTQAEYQAVMGENPSYFPGLNKPVESVSWYDALVYCNRKSARAGRTPCYNLNGNTDTSQWGYTPHNGDYISVNITCDFAADGYRLPTEAEWEYFARGGNSGNSNQTTYSGSNTIGSVAWYEENSGDEPHEVKKKRANALGLYDMSGNVWEWCWDWYGPISTDTPSTGAASGSSRVLRGGGWNRSASGCAVSRRINYGFNSRDRCDYIGFRVVSSRSE